MADENFAIASLTAGQLNAVVKQLGGPKAALRLLRGELEVRDVEHLIDLDLPPLIPYENWVVEEHCLGGKLKWNPERVKLHLSPSQQAGQTIGGHKLRKELVTHSPRNANLLDYLVDHPHLIPELWKRDEKGQTRFIYFWGTVYCDPAGGPCVRSLFWLGGHWLTGCYWLDSVWGEQGPAVVPASET